MKALHALLVALIVLSAVGAGLPAAGVAAGPVSAPAAGSSSTGAPAAGPPAATRVTTGTRPDVGETDAQVDRPSAPPGTINVLGGGPVTPNRSDLATAHVDLGPSLGGDVAETSHRLETIRAVERVETAESGAERTERLRAEVESVEERADALGRTQRRAVDEYVEDRRTARELLVALAAVDREARALDDRRQRLWRVANRTGVSVDDERFAALDRELDAYDGPVRERAAAVLAGEAAMGRFYVAAAPRTVVLATLAEGEYLREAYRGDLRRLGDDAMSERGATDAVAGGYPDVWRVRERSAVEGGRVARARVDYRGGSLTALIGSGNERVFADEHRHALGTGGTTATAVNTRDGLRMAVNRSYAGGAMQVRLRDTNGERVNASVTIGPAGGQSVAVGHTGDDAELWLLTPGEQFTVVAIRGQSVVFLTMSPLDTPDPGTTGADADR